MVQKAFPAPDIARRGDLDEMHRYKKYISQIITIHTAFVQSRPKIEEDFDFLTILRDAAFFLEDDGYKLDGVPLSETGIEIGKVLVEKDHGKVFFVLLDCISCLGVFSEWLGTEGRLRAVQITSDALEMLKKHFGERPIRDWTELEKMRYGRAYHEYGVKIIHFNRIEESSEMLGKALYYLSKIQDQDPLKARIANIVSFQALIEASRHDPERAVDMINRSLTMMLAAVGTDSAWYVQAKNGEANITFTIGNVRQAVKLYEDLLKIRVRMGGKSDHDTLSCQYIIAVCYQNLGDLEKAE